MSGRVTTGDSYVIAGVDGTDESYAALAFAMREAVHDGQKVLAVLAVDSSWDVEGDGDDEATVNAKTRSAERYLHAWVDVHASRIGFDPADLEVQTVRGTGLWRLTEDCMGDDGVAVSQVVVSRRGSGPFAGWANGSLPAALADAVKAPVTVVCVPEDADMNVNAKADETPSGSVPLNDAGKAHDEAHVLPMVVGVDGSDASLRALRFAVREAAANHMPLEVLMCWQRSDLERFDAGLVAPDAVSASTLESPAAPGSSADGGASPVLSGQRRAEIMLRRMMAQVEVPEGLHVHASAVEVPMAWGMVDASRRAGWLVMGCDVDESASMPPARPDASHVGRRPAAAPVRGALRGMVRRIADMVGHGRHSAARWMMGHAMCVATVVG